MSNPTIRDVQRALELPNTIGKIRLLVEMLVEHYPVRAPLDSDGVELVMRRGKRRRQ